MLKAVVYTDGSARPNPGDTGWGFHAYVYEEENKKRSAQPPKYKTTNVGYLNGEQIKVGLGEQVFPMAYYDGAGGIANDSTNNVGEIMAAYKALVYFSQEVQVSSIRINTDSEYVIYGFKRTLEDIRKADPPVANSELWTRVLMLYNDLLTAGVEIEIHKVKAHGDELGNNLADEFANIGRIMAKNGVMEDKIVEHTASTYWRKQSDKDPLMCFKTMFISSDNRKESKTAIYYLFKADSKLPYGKSSSKATYGSLWLKEPSPTVEMVLDKHEQITADTKGPSILRLDVLFSLPVQMRLRSFGSIVLTNPPKNGSKGVYVSEEEPVTKLIWPPGISYKMENVFSMLDNTLYAWTSGDNDITNSEFHDITKELLEDLSTKSEKIKLKTPLGNFTLLYKTDMPDKSVIKKVKNKISSAALVVWRDGDIKRFGVLLDTEDSVSVWSNIHAAFTI